jgi:hypothetical protein
VQRLSGGTRTAAMTAAGAARRHSAAWGAAPTWSARRSHRANGRVGLLRFVPRGRRPARAAALRAPAARRRTVPPRGCACAPLPHPLPSPLLCPTLRSVFSMVDDPVA